MYCSIELAMLIIKVYNRYSNITYCEHCSAALSWLAIVKVEVEEMLHFPVRQQRSGGTKQNAVGAIDVANPNRQFRGL